jgi:hypothetical protein
MVLEDRPIQPVICFAVRTLEVARAWSEGLQRRTSCGALDSTDVCSGKRSHLGLLLYLSRLLDVRTDAPPIFWRLRRRLPYDLD